MVRNVGQITPFTCVLACIESSLQDRGLGVDQQKLLCDCPQFCNEGTPHFGAVPFDKIGDIVRHYVPEANVEFLDGDAIEAALNEVGSDCHCYVLTMTEPHHCFRLCQKPEDLSMTLMDPSTGTARPWSVAEFAERKWVIAVCRIRWPKVESFEPGKGDCQHGE